MRSPVSGHTALDPSTPSDRTAVAFIASILILLCAGCTGQQEFRDLESILESGEIVVITRNNAHCYYLYREEPMGFEYDLAKAFADYLGLRLKVRIADTWEGMIPELANCTGDFIAAGMTVTQARRKQIAFSDGYSETRQHIIVHRSNAKVRAAEDLAGRSIHVRRGTTYQERLTALQEQGIDLGIVLHDDVPTQELIRQVEAKQIEVTIADNNIAMLNRRYYPRVVVADPIADKEYLGWAVNRHAHRLLESINVFFRTIKANGSFDEIYDRYYANVEFFDYLDLRAFHRRMKARLPRYLEIIQKAASDHDFDWRWIAAQIYQESHFDPDARSPDSAQGLMQLTGPMASSLGVEDLLDPEQNINAGVAYLKYLYDHYDRAEDPDRLLVALAAYNIGIGHTQDARDLARAMGLDPDKWSSLTKTLPLLRYYKYHKSTRYGYARGTEPIGYVKQIKIYYDILKHQSIEYETTAPSRERQIRGPAIPVRRRG